VSRRDYSLQRRFPFNDSSFLSGDIRDQIVPPFDVFGPPNFFGGGPKFLTQFWLGVGVNLTEMVVEQRVNR